MLFYKLSTGLSSTNKSATSLFLSSTCSVVNALSSPPSFFYLKHFSTSGANYHFFLPLLSGYHGSLDTHFFLEMVQLINWSDGVPTFALCSLSPLTPCMYSSLFSHWRCTVSYKFFNTQDPSVTTEELVLPCNACCVLSHLSCNKNVFF